MSLPDINAALRTRHNELHRAVMEMEAKLERATRGGDINAATEHQQQQAAAAHPKKTSKARMARLEKEAHELEEEVSQIQQRVAVMERHDALEIAIERRETESQMLRDRNRELRKKIRENSRLLEHQPASEERLMRRSASERVEEILPNADRQ